MRMSGIHCWEGRLQREFQAHLAGLGLVATVTY